MAEHVDLPDAERHEPKGASTAVDNTVLKSNGDTTTSFGFVNYSEVQNTPVGVAVATLSSDADLDNVRLKVNELLVSLRNAGLIAS